MANVNSLAYVVNQALADVDLPSTTHFQRFLHWAIKGYKAINLLGMMPNIKTVSLVIDQETRSAQLPQDYIDYIRIGVCCNGIFINFDYNEEICLQGSNMPTSCCETNDIGNSIAQICQTFPNGCNDCNAGEWGTWYWPTWTNGLWDYSLPNFGIGPGSYHGGYRINSELKTIQFDNCVHAQTFVMEYISTGFDNMGNAMVPEDAIPTLNAYIHWQRCLFMRGATPMDTRWIRQEAQNFNRLFITYLDDWSHRQNSMTKFDWLDIVRRFTFQQAKS
jgi:hypothetical protein